MLDDEMFELGLFLAGADCYGTLAERLKDPEVALSINAPPPIDPPSVPRYKRMPTILPRQDAQNRQEISLLIGELNQLGKLELALVGRTPLPMVTEFLCGEALRDTRTKRNARAAHKRSVFRWNADELKRLQDFKWGLNM